MDQLISIECNDIRFNSHLDGTFSSSHRAIPTKSLNLNTKREFVTFKIVPIGNVARPSLALLWWEALRLSSICLSLGPLISTFLLLRSKGIALDHYLAVLCFLPIFLLHASMNLLNDYYDHLKGVDRAGSVHVIQKGWVRAIDLFYWGNAFLVTGLLVGLIILFQAPNSLFPLVILSAVGIMEFSSNRMGLKYLGMGEVTIFFLAGPLLVMGYAIAVSAPWSYDVLALGVLSGLLALFTLHINNMREALNNSLAGVKNLVTIYGFDRSKPMAGLVILGIAVSWWYILFSLSRNPLSYVFWLLGILILKWSYYKIVCAKSSMSSHLKTLIDYRYRIYFGIMFFISLSIIL